MLDKILFTVLSIVLTSIFLLSCDSKEEVIVNNIKGLGRIKETILLVEQSKKILPPDWDNLRDINTVDPSIQIDLKYATTDNFMHRVLYDTLTRVFLQKDVALRLSKCQKFLKGIDSTFSLLVYDGMRPLSVQQEMWDALDTLPFNERIKFVSNPKNGSIHNYGAAVDLTIVKNGIPLDMGAGYDDMRKIAYPKYESLFLENGELTETHIQNRKLLRNVMKSQGFMNISTEWWHFNAFTRAESKLKYTIIE
ncbi:MAG: D-alanyl-D-alanine dipeptidase [Psychromonas sp.]|jgi:D-alanyl-D-alanine dipeptidase